MQDESASEEEPLYCTESVGTVGHQHKRQFFVVLCFLDENWETLVPCQLDTGATINVMSFDKLIHVQYCQLDSIGKNRSSIRPICSIWRIEKFLDEPTSSVFYLPFASH